MLLPLLILVWGLSWPVIKVGVATVPPIWYGTLRYVIAAGCLFLFVGVRRELAWPPRADRRIVAVSGALQMGAYSALTGLALTRLPPGRAAVLAFSTPLWVVPLSAWWLGERHSCGALLGVGLGLTGVLVIAAPSLRSDAPGQAAAYVMLLGAAAVWAISIVAVRAHRFHATPLALAPWQMLVAGALLCPLAHVIEGPAPEVGTAGVASLAYVGPVATAFAYWAVVELGRRLRASTISMALLSAPALGLVISALTTGESVTAPLLVGIVLIACGIRMSTRRVAAQIGEAPHQ
jgi:drug/metabolite transporter (DMT)-like permease